MKKNITYLLIMVISILLIVVGSCKSPLYYCEVKYSEDPHTRKLVVSCEDKNCNKTCYLFFRKKRSEDEWKQPNDSHSYDTTIWEYKCKCQ